MHSNSKYLVCWLLVIIAFPLIDCSITTAQQCELAGGRKAAKALSFSFNGLNINEFYGGVGGKYWISNKTALFGSFDFGARYDQDDPGQTYAGDSESRHNDMNLTIGMEKHFYPCRKVSPYWGFYGRIGYSYTKTTEEPASEYDLKGEKEESSLDFSTGLMLGVEYWIVKDISLAAQYMCGASYYLEKTVLRQGEEEIKDTAAGFDLGLGAASLILSVYF
ncbi:MAG: hypothetical protein AB1847_10810 [bacterium]